MPQDKSTNLELPYIIAAQAQKHVIHNEALRTLDAVVHLSVLDRDLSTPPPSPADGDRYIVDATATGAWTGQENKVAAFQDGAWAFLSPREGWLAWVVDEGALVVWDGAVWVPAAASSDLQNVPLVGINTTADTTNRLAIRSSAVLLDNVGAGQQTKINKQAATDTASLLFQTNYSGRAEFGLAGNDDFSVKVSANGSTWTEALRIDRTTGKAAFPATPMRETLTANRTYYVRTDGNDANTGLANTAGGAFATIQKAVDTAASLDSALYDVTILVNTGTYTGPVTLKALLGSGLLTVQGDTTTPSNVVVSTTNAHCFAANNVRRVLVTGFKTQTTTAGTHIFADAVSDVRVGRWEFGTAAGGLQHVDVAAGSRVSFEANYTISGGANTHWYASLGGRIRTTATITVTITGTPAFATAFAVAGHVSLILSWTITFSGAATGTRYIVAQNSVIDTAGAGANHFAGNAAGFTASGGQYL